MIYWRLEHRWRHHQPHVAFALYCVCEAKDHRWRQNVVRTSVTHTEPRDSFLFLPHLDVICDLLLNRRKATWDRFVKSITTEQQLSYFLLIFLFENRECFVILVRLPQHGTTLGCETQETVCVLGWDCSVNMLWCWQLQSWAGKTGSGSRSDRRFWLILAGPAIKWKMQIHRWILVPPSIFPQLFIRFIYY